MRQSVVLRQVPEPWPQRDHIDIGARRVGFAAGELASRDVSAEIARAAVERDDVQRQRLAEQVFMSSEADWLTSSTLNSYSDDSVSCRRSERNLSVCGSSGVWAVMMWFMALVQRRDGAKARTGGAQWGGCREGLGRIDEVVGVAHARARTEPAAQPSCWPWPSVLPVTWPAAMISRTSHFHSKPR